MISHDVKRVISLVIIFAALTTVTITAEEGADEGEDGLPDVRHLSGECCWSFHQKPLHQLKLDEILWRMQCNQIAADSIGIVQRDNLAGLEMSMMTKDELMELVGMSMVSAWRVSRCKDVADGIRRWPANNLQGDAILHQQAAAQLQQKASPLQGGVGEVASTNQQEQNRGRSWEDMTGKRCFGLSRVHDAARTPDHCQEQCSRHPDECGLWLYWYVEGCWIGNPRENYICRYEEGWLGSIRLEQRAFHHPATLPQQLLDNKSTSPHAFSTTLPASNQAECGWDHPECVRPRSRAGVQRRLAIRRPVHGALVYALSNETSYMLQIQVLSLLALLVQKYKYWRRRQLCVSVCALE